MAKGAASVLGRLGRQRDGAVAAEFAMIFPIFFSFVAGGLEYGSIAYSINAMQQAANVAARDMAVNRLSAAEARLRMNPFLPG